MSQYKSDSYLFPRRNRIVAGMSDATVVIESGSKGGSMITARLAADYGRDVFALPGRVSDQVSKGCNQLIKQQRALLVESGEEIAAWMGWEKYADPGILSQASEQQKETVKALSPFEEALLKLIERESAINTDQLKIALQTDIKQLSTALINLELAGLIVSLPGNRYQPI
jgi:DNA processing protein